MASGLVERLPKTGGRMEPESEHCWEICGCAEQRRANCPAFRAQRNCWEVAGTPISSDLQQMACENCPVILSRIARAIAEAMGQTQHGSVAKRRR